MSTEQPTKLDAGTGGSIEALIQRATEFIRVNERHQSYTEVPRLLIADLRAALLTRRDQPESQIDCPLCGKTVKQVSSATLSLALWQHVNWVCKAATRRDAPQEQDTWPWGEAMKQHAVLGIGAEAWVELEEIERRGVKQRNNDLSGMSISWRTFRLVMTVLRAIRLKDFQVGRDADPAKEPGMHAMIEQFCRDLNDAHNEILKLQGVKPEDFDKYDWPEWSGPANSIRWAERLTGKRLAKTALWSEVPNLCRCPDGTCLLHPTQQTCSLRQPASAPLVAAKEPME